MKAFRFAEQSASAKEAESRDPSPLLRSYAVMQGK